MYLVVAYDVVEDRLRRRLHKALHGFLDHVQKSVFEGELRESRYPELTRLAGRLIDRETDSVRVYQLCARCRNLTEVIGTGVYVEPQDSDVIL